MLKFTAVAIVLLASAHYASRPQGTCPQPCSQAHSMWVSKALIQMEMIKPGKTRAGLLNVFRTEGGVSTGLHRIYVSRQCPYFKVDVDFEAVGRSSQAADGGVALHEDDRDIITGISRPYLQFS